MKTFKIQGKEYEAKDPEAYTVSDYNQARLLVDTLNNFLTEACAEELEAVELYQEDFAKLTDGVTLESFEALKEDEVIMEKLQVVIFENLKKFPECGKILRALQQHAASREAAQESFLSLNTTMKNSFGTEKIIDNLRLVFDAHLKNCSGIKTEVAGIDNITELLQAGKDVLEDFFRSTIKWKNKLKVSMMILKTFPKMNPT